MDKEISEIKDIQEVVFSDPEHRTGAFDYSPLALAFLGDGVFDLVIRSFVLKQGNRQVHKLHEETRRYVNAAAQSEIMRTLQGCLSPEESTIYKRGRNVRTVTPPKNQSMTDYRRATGFEALIGYLYIQGRFDRIWELITMGIDSLRSQEDGNHDV